MNLISESYVQYVERYYGKQVTIVFDGYQQGLSTKDPTHQRHKTKGVRPMVKLQRKAVMSHKKDVFLSNDTNKQNFILKLGEMLPQNGYSVNHTSADANFLIVKTAVEFTQSCDIVVVESEMTQIC